MSAVLSGIFGGLSATFCKMMINIVTEYPLPEAYSVTTVYVFLGCMLTCVFSNLYNLNFITGLYR